MTGALPCPQLAAERTVLLSRMRDLDEALVEADAKTRQLPEMESRVAEMKDLVLRLGKENQAVKGRAVSLPAARGFKRVSRQYAVLHTGRWGAVPPSVDVLDVFLGAVESGLC